MHEHPILSPHSEGARNLTLTWTPHAQDRGYHALRSSSERNQRVLHRLLHNWEEVLSRPVAAVFVAAADAVGGAKDLEAGASALGLPSSSAGAVVGSAGLPAVDDDEEAKQAFALQDAAWDAHAQAVAAGAAARVPSLSVLSPGSYVARVSPLTARLAAVLGHALSSGAPERVAGPSCIEDICAAVVSRAAALRTDRNATRPMKKKALTDLLRALVDVGVSPRRSAVPASDREPASWFVLPRVDAEPAFGGVPWDTGSTRSAWLKAEAYYFRNMARVQVRAWLSLFSPCATLTDTVLRRHSGKSTAASFTATCRRARRRPRVTAWNTCFMCSACSAPRSARQQWPGRA